MSSLTDRAAYSFAIKMLGPRNHWPSITDYMYLVLIEQFCDAADGYAVKVLQQAQATIPTKAGKKRVQAIVDDIKSRTFNPDL